MEISPVNKNNVRMSLTDKTSSPASDPDSAKRCWLLVERLENWKVDQSDAFRHFGLPDRKKHLADQIKKGDLLIFYISTRVSCFSDVREAVADATTKLPMGGAYDTGYSWRVFTKPVLTLPPHKWVPLKNLAPLLTFTAGKRNLGLAMRNSLRRLGSADANCIVRSLLQSENLNSSNQALDA